MTPTTETELAEAIRDATGPLRITGGGTRPVGQAPGDALHTTGLSGITLYDPGALTIVARAGTPVAEIEAALAEENQRLAFEPMDHRAVLKTEGTPTIGGIVATNTSGPRRIAVGACRDFLLGVRFVDGSGAVVKNGGRVMKNVTGYDLVKLICGSHGTLGVLTEVSLKVLPRPETTATLIFDELDDARAIAAMSAAMGSPYEVTGAAHAGGRTLIRIEGFAQSVAYRSDALRRHLEGFGTPTIDSDPALWTAVRDARTLADVPGNLWRISVRPSVAARLVSGLNPVAVQYDWAGGLVWVVLPEGRNPRDAMGDTGGHATLIRGQSDAPAFHPEPAPLAAVSQGLRGKFDPRGILNPGLMT